ncbi:MAG: rod shape-determining protein MreC [Ignavibacteriae bacterium]|nr:MAG: rod shape-determining protein MreC [Ignavibacteriota bacterium]
MKTIISYVGSLKEYFIYSFLVIISLIMVFQNDNVQIRFMRAAAVSVIGLVQSSFSVIPNVFQLERENRNLREDNNSLAIELSQLKEAKLENLRLTKMLEFKERTKYPMVSAKILGKTLIQTRNTITLNTGENDGIKVGMPVITEKGLIGKIIATSSSYSIAQIIFNKDLKISAKVQRSRVDGIIAWEGETNLLLKNVSKSADILEGDVLITSEYSNSFPAGIPIGYVTSLGTIDNLFKKVLIKPFVNFETLEEVFVLKNLSNEERQNLEKKFLGK